ncbi:hypothetical protein [Gluconobacter oxydans]|uniref:hypothetical protein n=1 Tax=Gluconobacter oxydans TaxID=442 RepID=UPI0026470B38|nr:hypothetical protein [Gluconobacter oxydans]WKE49653.1 hypothetical protein NUJ38_14075 [Gluconobacter oxydans]
MTRIILQHGQNAPITLDVDGKSMAPIHLHFSQAPDSTAVQAEPVAAVQKSRIRRFLPAAGVAAVCGVLFLTFGGLQASAPSMPESAALPPLPMTGPMEVPAAPVARDSTQNRSSRPCTSPPMSSPPPPHRLPSRPHHSGWRTDP